MAFTWQPRGLPLHLAGTNLASPQDVHHAVIGPFEALIETGILYGQRGKTGQDGEELDIIFMKGAWLTGIDAHYPNNPAMHL